MPKILIFDPSNPKATAWRDFNGIGFELQPLLATDLRQIRADIESLKLSPVDAANEQDRRFADHIIRDWRGPVTPDRTKLPPTAANKFALVNGIAGLKQWLTMESDKVAESTMIQEDTQLGNSGGSPGGSGGGLESQTAAP